MTYQALQEYYTAAKGGPRESLSLIHALLKYTHFPAVQLVVEVVQYCDGGLQCGHRSSSGY